MHNQSFAQIRNWAKSWSDASVRWFICARAAVFERGPQERLTEHDLTILTICFVGPFLATTFIHKRRQQRQHRRNDVVCLNINRIRIQFTRSHFTLLEGESGAKSIRLPREAWHQPRHQHRHHLPAHSPLIIGFYLSIYLVGTGKHQNIIEIPKYLNHKGSSWFYFIFFADLRHCQIGLTTVWPDTAWILLKILLKLPIHSFGISSIIIAWNCAKMTILFWTPSPSEPVEILIYLDVFSILYAVVR